MRSDRCGRIGRDSKTQSSELIAAASEISPANTVPATISANFRTLPDSGTIHYLQRFVLGRQTGAAANGGDDQRGQGDRNIQVLFLSQLGIEECRSMIRPRWPHPGRWR